ncbi:MAG: selenoprotein B, partial [Anaerobacillus sp.]
MCQQSAGLVARILEEHGIPTVALTMSKEISEQVNVPRSLYNRFPFGSAVGQPDNKDQQKQVLNKALD